MGNPGSSQRDSAAAGGRTRRSYMSMNRAVGRVVARGDGGDPMPRVHAPAGYGMGAALNITALVRLPGSHPACQPSAEPAFPLRGRGSFRRVAPARARFALTPRCEPHLPSGGASGEVRQGKHGPQRSRARRLMAEVSDQCGFISEVGHFPSSEMERQRSVAVGKWSCSRLLAGGACTHRARRSLAAYCRCLARAKHRGLLLVHVGRSLATSCLFPGCARSEAGLASLRSSESR
jgi:hypothetical protein